MAFSLTETERKFAEALEKGDLDRVDLMLTAGEARITQPLSQYNDQPIHLAAGKGNIALIELLVRHGADINATDTDGDTPLITAAHWNEPAAVKKLLELGAEYNFRPPKSGMTALFRAASENRLGIVEILTDAGADTNIATDSGLTALFSAALRGHMEVAKRLVDCGAKLDQKGNGLGVTEFAEMVGRSGGDAKRVSDFLSSTKLGREATEGTAEKVTVRNKPLSFKKPE